MSGTVEVKLSATVKIKLSQGKRKIVFLSLTEENIVCEMSNLICQDF